jgi:Cdc6-like AAA superfamily ATPase
MPPQRRSRLANSKLAFKPYNQDQLRTIVNARLGQQLGVLSPEAVSFACRKVRPHCTCTAMAAAR